MKAVKFTGKEFLDASGNVVAPEFGDRDQIALLRAYESQFPDPKTNEDGDAEEEATGEIIEVDITFKREYNYDFQCTCGKWIYGSDSFEEFDDESDILRDLDGEEVNCRSCGSKYQLDSDGGELRAFKIVKS